MERWRGKGGAVAGGGGVAGSWWRRRRRGWKTAASGVAPSIRVLRFTVLRFYGFAVLRFTFRV